jgi:Protein of unknown function (DUF3866)
MLKLRRGIVVKTDPLTVEVDGERRAAWADRSLVGEVREGDEVVVNTEALDLHLGSGGFDLVHVNLSRGLSGGGAPEPHVMKLNYTSLQHPVRPLERAEGAGRGDARSACVLVIPLHGHLAPAAWAASTAAPGLRIGYVQSVGGALAGTMSKDVSQLRERGLLFGHVTAGHSFGGEEEAISVAGALDAAAASLGWDAVIVGPGPGLLGSATRYGHGGMAALDSAHAALALGMRTLLSPRLSQADPRPRHRGVSHHTVTVLGLLLGGVEVPVPEGETAVIEALREALGARHHLRPQPAALDDYAASGLPQRTMGRSIKEDPIFYAAPLAAGLALAQSASPARAR